MTAARTAALALAVALVASQATPSSAYEAATTHAGLTEQAAAHSQLHDRLRDQFGFDRGLFAPLIVPPPDAPQLFTLLRRFNPTHGYVPDGRGRLSALGWLVAGSVVADSPPDHAANHFLDPDTGKGLSDRSLRGVDAALKLRLDTGMAGDRVVRSGIPASEWATDASNPMGLSGFIDQYQKAVRTRTAGERERHMAGALLAAGALLHLLQDMGSPSHVRDDLAAHLERIGRGRLDVGSRFERVAALAYGRLGVPGPQAAVKRDNLLAFFTGKDGGLADQTARRWFSAGTLPGSISLRGQPRASRLKAPLAASVRRPAPVPLPRLDLFAAAREPVALVDGAGVCVARYQVRKARLEWNLDDDCYLEQLAVILPQVAGYSAGLIDYLFRGQLTLVGKQQLTVAAGGADFGAGKLELFWDDPRGVRTPYAEVVVEGGKMGKALGKAARPPKGAVAVTALFVGADASGQPLVAAGRLAL